MVVSLGGDYNYARMLVAIHAKLVNCYCSYFSYYLEAHHRDTITSWGTRRSTKAQLTKNKENLAPSDPDQHQVSLRELVMIATHCYTIYNMICWTESKSSTYPS